ncbi:MAG: helix-turn-helix domain-containing protein [Oscillospiraceae bacterium]|nr:helix-turn-helix domain-containing protein [Oscillospiraceae bacterium]
MNIETANKLLRLRKKNGYSQEELAEKLGISRQAVSKWERAEASPDTDNLIQLAKLYNISLDQLFEIDAVNSVPISSQESRRSNISLRKDKSDKDNSMRVAYPEGSNGAKEIYPGASAQQKSQPVYQDTQKKQQTDGTCDFDKYQYKYEYSTKSQKSASTGTNASFNTNFTTSPAPAPLAVSEQSLPYKALMAFPFPLVVAALYLMLGAFFNFWHPSWMMFLTIPLYYTTIEAVRKKDLNIFCFPVLVVFAYLTAGFLLNLWHPAWILFMTIPFYYWIINIKKSK